MFSLKLATDLELNNMPICGKLATVPEP